VLRRKLQRAEVLKFFASLSPCLVGIEACSTAHHWAREIRALGHEVRLMPASHVKPYVKRGKTDAAYAEAICEAVTRPTMRFVPIKTVDQQAVLMMQRTRDLLVRQRTMLVNALRGHMAELGIIAPRGSAAWAISWRHCWARMKPSCQSWLDMRSAGSIPGEAMRQRRAGATRQSLHLHREPQGRKMADGTPFDPASNAAASKSLSLGTTARVTNLKNGRTTVVKIRDRGPYKAGRIIDVSPGSADALGRLPAPLGPPRLDGADPTSALWGAK